MKKLLLIWMALTGSLVCIAQQRAMYTQYMFNGLAVNPAYSATDGAPTATALSRHQWVGFTGAPNTQTFAAHSAVRDQSNTSLGLLIFRDQIGEVISEKGAYLSAAQRVPLNANTYLSLGLDAGLSMNQASFSDKFNESSSSVDDPAFQNFSSRNINLGWGLMMFSDRFYAGLSSPHFYNKEMNSGDGTSQTAVSRPHYILQGGFITPLNDALKFKPNLLVKYVRGSPVQVDLNANFLIKETVWVGASYRSFDSFDALTQIYISPGVALGYSYDFVTTKLRQVQKGSHEIMLQFRLAGKGSNYPRCFF